MLCIGVTGGIGCGKSVVSDLFATLGVPVIDADHVARELVEPGSPLLAEIERQFSSLCITADGHLDRVRLREIVFADRAKLRQLETILHPRIRAELQRWSSAQRAPYGLLVVPLLIECGWLDLVDRILVVDCSVERQRERIRTRDGISLQQAERIMETQLERKKRLSTADEVIDNDHDHSSQYLSLRVRELDQFYRQLAAQPP